MGRGSSLDMTKTPATSCEISTIIIIIIIKIIIIIIIIIVIITTTQKFIWRHL